MTWTRKRIIIAVSVVYIAGLVILGIAFGKSPKANFDIQSEFKLTPWVKAGPLEINRGVVYLFLSILATLASVAYVSRKMQQRPNRVQTAVETMYSLMRDNISRGNLDPRMAARWFPFLGTVFLFLWWCNIIGYIPLPTNSEETINIFGVAVPSFALYAATANVSVAFILSLVVFILFNAEGFRKWGFRGYFKHLMPSGVGKLLVLVAPLEIISTFMRLVSLTIRLWANILAGHMIILFMSGGMAVILGITAIGWLTLPLGVAVFMFEVGLIASLQAFIFATLSAIYLAGAVEGGH
ncbi:MAG: F0F1 ATP synthase subunit A [Solirubrobacterales bacterium]|nr:F0F1 ATP synthase subunit A [Solirubrobacterales bacterium]